VSQPSHPAILLRPTLETKFQIDYDWWRRADRDVEVFLRDYLCPQHQQALAAGEEELAFDFVDPETAEVRRMGGMQQVLMSHCARQPGYLGPDNTMVDSVFRILLANGNSPVSSNELSQRLGRPAQTILRTLSGARVYKGIRPILEAG
jgi:hypothetical protein